MRKDNRLNKGKVHSTRTSKFVSKLSRLLSRLEDLLLWILVGIFLLLYLVFEGLFIIIFLVSSRYQSILGREDIADISDNIEHLGIVHQPPDGGFITYPIRTTWWLRRGYGQKGAASRCILLLSKGPLTNSQEERIVGLARCVLYRLGDSIKVKWRIVQPME